VPIRHTPAHQPGAPPGEDTTPADRVAEGATTAPAHRTVLADEHGWPFYVFDQIEHLASRLAVPRLPSAVLDPAAPLPALDEDDHDGDGGCDGGEGLTVPYVLAVLGPKTAAPELVDRAWRYLITTTRARRGLWNLYALGLARLGLHKTAEAITPRRPPTVKARVQQLLAAEFLIEMHRTEPDPDSGQQLYAFDLDKPYVYARLRDHCEYVATKRRWARQARARNNMNWDDFAYLHEIEPSGNTVSRLFHIPGRLDAYTVLARLVTQTAAQRHGRRLTAGDAALIALTHLVGYPLSQAAAMLGLPGPTARMRQHRARLLIADLLDDRDHTATTTDPDEATERADP